MKIKKAYLAGGCFWGLEQLFRGQKGVLETEVGYMGGKNENPTYNFHPGHAEAIEILYNQDETNYTKILDYFFRIHDPTTIDCQGNDKGSSYRSAIFYCDPSEKKIAEKVIALVNESRCWASPVVSLVVPYVQFWTAEEYHQDYLIKHPNGYTCHFERFGSFLED